MQNIIDNQTLSIAKSLGETISVMLDSRESIVTRALGLTLKPFKGAPNGVLQLGQTAFYPVVYEQTIALNTTSGLPTIGDAFPDGLAQKSYKVRGYEWQKNLEPQRYLRYEFAVLNTNANDRATLEERLMVSKSILLDISLLRAMVADYEVQDTAMDGNTTSTGKFYKLSPTKQCIGDPNQGLNLEKLTQVRQYFIKNLIAGQKKIYGFVTFDAFNEQLLADPAFVDRFKVQLSNKEWSSIDLGYDITAQMFDLKTLNMTLIIVPNDAIFKEAGLYDLATDTIKFPFCTKDAITRYKATIGDGSWSFDSNPLVSLTTGLDHQMIMRTTGIAQGLQHDIVDLHFRFFGAAVRSANREMLIVKSKYGKVMEDLTDMITTASTVS